MWLKAQGYACTTSERGVEETNTFTCGHCQRVKAVKARQRPEDVGGLCYGCMKIICERCVQTGVCDPIEKKLERWEASYHARRSYAA